MSFVFRRRVKVSLSPHTHHTTTSHTHRQTHSKNKMKLQEQLEGVLYDKSTCALQPLIIHKTNFKNPLLLASKNFRRISTLSKFDIFLNIHNYLIPFIIIFISYLDYSCRLVYPKHNDNKQRVI